MNKHIITNALMNAGLTAGYVILVATFLTHLEQIFGNTPNDGVLVPVFMLTLLIVSAAVTGFLVLSKPAMWYLDGKKSEALKLFAVTLAFLFFFAAFVLSVLL